MQRLALILLLLPVFIGCGSQANEHAEPAKPLQVSQKSLAPRYDATTPYPSAERLMEAMSPLDRDQFQAVLSRHLHAYSGYLDRQKDLTYNEDDLWKPLHGLTAAEIHKKVEAEEREYGPANAAWEKAIQEGKVKRQTVLSGSPDSEKPENGRK